MKRTALHFVLVLAAGVVGASAAPIQNIQLLPVVPTITSTVSAYNSPTSVTSGFPLPAVPIGTFTYTIPTGMHIVSATFSSTFGNDNFHNTGAVKVYVGGILVGTCAVNASCTNSEDGTTPFHFNFAADDFATLSTGSEAVTAVQLGPNRIRLGLETLTITTAANPTPEPSTMALLGLGLAGVGTFRLRKRKV